MSHLPAAAASAYIGAMIDEILYAFMFLTRLPVRLRTVPADGVAARAMLWFPLVGAVVGAVGGVVYYGARGAGLPALAASLLALAATVLLTGALHEDGLADTADGFGGGRAPELMLAIMRDSRIGAFGTVALILALGLRAAALAAMPGARGLAILIAAEALSRAALPALALVMHPARRDGLAAAQGRGEPIRAAAAAVMGLAIAASAVGPVTAAAAAIAAGAAAAALGALAQARIGGYTGDVLGAAQQLAVIAALLVMGSHS